MGMFEVGDPSRTQVASLTEVFLAIETSARDRRFHDDIMGGKGEWWKDDTKTQLSFFQMWRMLEERTIDVRGPLS
jgi:hypothetical protein